MSDRVLRAVMRECEKVIEAGNPNHFPAVHEVIRALAVRIEFAQLEEDQSDVSPEERRRESLFNDDIPL